MCVCISPYACMRACMCVCTYVCMHRHICVAVQTRTTAYIFSSNATARLYGEARVSLTRDGFMQNTGQQNRLARFSALPFRVKRKSQCQDRRSCACRLRACVHVLACARSIRKREVAYACMCMCACARVCACDQNVTWQEPTHEDG